MSYKFSTRYFLRRNPLIGRAVRTTRRRTYQTCPRRNARAPRLSNETSVWRIFVGIPNARDISFIVLSCRIRNDENDNFVCNRRSLFRFTARESDVQGGTNRMSSTFVLFIHFFQRYSIET